MTLHESARNWNPPDSLGYSSLRPVRLSCGGRVLAVLAAVMAIGGAILGMVLAGESRRQATARDLLRDEGVLTDATVLRVWRTGGEDSKRRVRYRFETLGREWVASYATPRAIWETLRTGSTIPVRYVPAEPGINHPAAWNRKVMPWFLSVIVASIFLAGGWLMTFMIRRQWRLLSEGRPAPGLVTGFKKAEEAVSVLYEFRLLNGTMQKGSGSAGNKKKLPAVGSVVCVLYNPENPRRNALYPLQFVRPAVN